METQNKQTKYESIKNAVKKYGNIALLAGALALPNYASAEDSLITAETRSNAIFYKTSLVSQMQASSEAQEKTYSNYLDNAKFAFNKAVQNRKFTLDEQKQVAKYLGEAEKIHKNLPVEYKNIDSLIDKNLNRLDVGTPELQKELEAKGLEVEVEGTEEPEAKVFFNGFFLTLAGMGFLLCSGRRN